MNLCLSDIIHYHFHGMSNEHKLSRADLERYKSGWIGPGPYDMS